MQLDKIETDALGALDRTDMGGGQFLDFRFGQFPRRGIVAERNGGRPNGLPSRSEEHTSELQSLMRISYAVFCLKKKKQTEQNTLHKSKIATPPYNTNYDHKLTR